MEKEKILKINKRSFVTVCAILVSFMVLAYILTFILNKGEYNDQSVYQTLPGKGYSFFSFITAPFRLLASKDGLNVIVIALFILILAGSFNIMNETGGISSIIGYLIKKFQNRKYRLLYVVILCFMLFGSLFGIFEESVTLLPIIILLALSLGWDTFTGLGMCLLAAGFGFSTAITNPFSIGLGSDKMGINPTTNIWYRIIIFILMYLFLCLFMRLHVRKIEKDPKSSPTYESDQQKREALSNLTLGEYNHNILKVYFFFFLSVLLAIIAASTIPFLSGLSIPVIALTFLIGIMISGVCLRVPFSKLLKMFASGVVSMSPAIVMLMLAGSIKFILDDAKIMDTMIETISHSFKGQSPILGVLFIYLLVLVIQFFIGSASAKVILVIPIISVLAKEVGITQNLALLAFVFADGYTDLIYPTNPVLLIALGMASFNYSKWIKKTWLMQVIILIVTVGFLIIGYYINY
ncbi:MAG TPA: Na+/H+ antiporter NhaC family protein [Bacilli bacterium]